jgi:hypothetical protein
MSCTTVRFLDHLLPRNLLRNTLWCTGTRTGLLITVRAPKVRVASLHLEEFVRGDVPSRSGNQVVPQRFHSNGFEESVSFP